VTGGALIAARVAALVRGGGSAGKWLEIRGFLCAGASVGDEKRGFLGKNRGIPLFRARELLENKGKDR
jgi:hypothetical protein